MIRRDTRLSDGSAAWMLVSQVEHARISEQLARECLRDADFPSASMRDEVLAAIGHHDDGWEAWERAPTLDAEHGRPLAFTELDPRDAIAVWSRSIDAAAALGPLAAWIVAGHFLRLASKSDSVSEFAEVARWQAETVEHGRQWLSMWQSLAPRLHTPEAAAAALQALWTFDEASLWLCCTCIADEPIPCAPAPYRAGRGTRWEMELRTTAPHQATATPWRFASGGMHLAIGGLVVPARKYRNPRELMSAGRPAQVDWQLARPAH